MKLALVLSSLLIAPCVSVGTSNNTLINQCSTDAQCNADNTTLLVPWDENNCCGVRTCFEKSTNFEHARTTCMPPTDHMKLNKTNGEICSYYCQATGKTCVKDSDCSSYGSNYCCSVL